MNWPPVAKISDAVGEIWPGSLESFARWAVSDAPSIYILRHAQEVIENLIRADALDATALANLDRSPALPTSYSLEGIQQKMAALRIINIRITALDLDSPVDVHSLIWPP